MKFLGFLLLICFIIWHIRTSLKYAMKFDICKIDIENKYFILNKCTIIPFDNINYIVVKKGLQPNLKEKILTYARYNYMTDLLLYMKNGSCKKIRFNRKAYLRKILQTIQPYIRLEGDIESIISAKFSLFQALLIILMAIGAISSLYIGISGFIKP